MAKIGLAFSIMPDSPLSTIVEWTKQAEDAGFDGVFMTEANNDSLACCLGLGFNTRQIALGIDMGSPSAPMKKMRETVAALRRMFDGRTNPKISGRQSIFLAGVSRPMVRLAGEIADGVIFNFFPPERVKAALGEIREGAG